MPRKVLQEGLRLLKTSIEGRQVRIGAQVFGENGRWQSDSFPLLDLVGSVGAFSPYLTREYARFCEAVHSS